MAQPAPAQPSRRRRLRTIALVLGPAAITAGILSIVAIRDAGRPRPDTGRPARHTTSAGRTVQYDADGNDGAATGFVTMETPDGTEQAEVALPMVNGNGLRGVLRDDFAPGDFLYISVQNRDDWGSVTCRIIVDGLTIAENTSTGGHVIATCKGRKP